MNASNYQGSPHGLADTIGDPALTGGRGSLTREVSRRSTYSVRALWYSNAPWAGTGYGQQTQQAVQRLIKDGHEVAIHAIYGLEGSTSTWNGIKIYPRGLSPYSDDIVAAHWMDWTQSSSLPKLLMTLFDVWVLKAKNLEKVPNIASWVPIDHQPTPVEVAMWCKKPNVMPIAMSQFGHKQLNALGIRSLYVPHGIESAYKPGKVFKDKANRSMRGRELMGFDEDKFVVMMVAANKGVHPPRKAFAENLMAFSIFASTHPNAVLYMHTEPNASMGGIDLNVLIEMCGIEPEKVKFADPYLYRMGYPVEAMAALYSDADVLLATSMGEGFGIPVIESQACGTPVVVSKFSAQPELVGDGWTVDGQPFWDPAQQAWFFTPSVPGIVSALTESAKRPVGEKSEQAVVFAKQYEADHVYETFWKPAMKELAEWCRSSQS